MLLHENTFKRVFKLRLARTTVFFFFFFFFESAFIYLPLQATDSAKTRCRPITQGGHSASKVIRYIGLISVGIDKS
jgi:hypothetical protein